jgi:hypothetical protein
MIAGHVMPILARRIETALHQQGHHPSGEELEGFSLILGDIAAEAKMVEGEGRQDDGDRAPTPKTESEPLPETISPIGMPPLPPSEGLVQGEFLRPASMPLSLPGMIGLSARVPAQPEEVEPRVWSELQAGQLQKSASAEGLPISIDVDSRRTLIPILEAEGGNQHAKAAPAEVPYPDESPPEADSAFAAVKVRDADVSPYPSPAIQIMAAITAEAPRIASQPAMPSDSQPAHFNSPALPTASDVKALRIKLQPEEFGEVEVTIRRAGLQTKVTITVTGKAAADAVSKDKGILEERLSSLLNPGTGVALTFNMEIRDGSAGQEQSQMASGGQSFTETPLPDGRGSSREDRSDRQPQPLMRAGDERESENGDVSAASGSDRVV